MADPTNENLEEQFQDLYRRYYQPAVNYFLRRGVPPEECRDLAQETFLRVYRAMQHFRLESSYWTWILHIANNLFANWVRARRAQKRAAQEVSLEAAWEHGEPIFEENGLLLAPRASALEELVSREKRREFRDALADLPPRMLECVKLRIVEELKYREIAARQGVSVNTVKAHFFQARNYLRQRFGVELPASRPRGAGGDDE